MGWDHWECVAVSDYGRSRMQLDSFSVLLSLCEVQCAFACIGMDRLSLSCFTRHHYSGEYSSGCILPLQQSWGGYVVGHVSLVVSTSNQPISLKLAVLIWWQWESQFTSSGDLTSWTLCSAEYDILGEWFISISHPVTSCFVWSFAEWLTWTKGWLNWCRGVLTESSVWPSQLLLSCLTVYRNM